MLYLNYAFIPQILSVYGDTDLNKMELRKLECRGGFGTICSVVGMLWEVGKESNRT